ncbi:MAG TPA: TolC family protein [Paludibacter sp.]
MKSINKITIFLLLLPMVLVQGQNTNKLLVGDSLSFSQILNDVIHNYPSIKKAQNDIASSDAKIGMAKTAYLPDVNLTSSYSRIGPTSSFTLPINGVLQTIQLYPADNYSAAINVNQSIYDFGKTAKNVSFEQQNKELVETSVEQLKQRLSLMLVGNYYSIVFLQEAIHIKDEQLVTLNEHLHFVEKKEASGSATKFEIITTKVRISAIENQKTDILTALQIQLGQLNSFLGKPQETKLTVKKELLVPQIFAPNDSLFAFAFAHRNEMKLAHQKNSLAETRLKMVNAQNNPALNVFANGGLKNGYIPNLSTLTPNFAVGVGLKVPLFDANRSKFARIQVKADIQGNDQETELARRNIVNEVVESKANAESSLKKVAQSELQLEQAQQAYSLAETNFQAGVITNLDLLDSFTAVAESKLVLLKTKIDYTVNLLKLKIALGEQIY